MQCSPVLREGKLQVRGRCPYHVVYLSLHLTYLSPPLLIFYCGKKHIPLDWQSSPFLNVWVSSVRQIRIIVQQISRTLPSTRSYTINTNSPFPPSSPGNPTSIFCFCDSVCFRHSGIIHYLLFCDWLIVFKVPSIFQPVTCFPFVKAKWYFVLCIHYTFSCRWTVWLFSLSRDCEWCCKWVHKYFFKFFFEIFWIYTWKWGCLTI